MSFLLAVILLAVLLAVLTILVVMGTEFYSDLDRLSEDEDQFYDWMADNRARRDVTNRWLTEEELDEQAAEEADLDRRLTEYNQWSEPTPDYEQRVAEYEQWAAEEDHRERARGILLGAALVAAIAAAAGFTALRRR